MMLRTKILASFILVGMLPLCAMSYLIYSQVARVLEKEAIASLESTAKLYEDGIGQFRYIVQRRFDFLKAGLQNKDGSLKGGSALDPAVLGPILAEAQAARDTVVSEVFILDVTGRIAASSDPAHIGADESMKEYFRNTATGARLFPQRTEQEPLYFYVAGPLEERGKKAGTLVFKQDAEELMGYFSGHPSLGDTGEAVLAAKRTDGSALVLVPLRFDPKILSFPMSEATSRLPMTQALNGVERTYAGVFDYRGKIVLSATRSIPELGWGIVVKRDRSDALAITGSLRLSLFVIWCSLGLVIVIISYGFSKKITGPLRRLLGMIEDISAGKTIARETGGLHDEFDEVAEQFMKMAEKVRSKRESLEQLVDDRTRELNQKMHELERSNSFLDSVFGNIPDMIFVKDAKDLRFLKFNKAGEELIGAKEQDILGKNDYDFFPKDQADFFTQKDRAVLEGREVVDIPEEPFDSNKQKGRRILHTKKVPILDADGNPRYLLGISEDITDRKRVENDLERSKRELEEQIGNVRKFQQAVEAAGEAIVITDVDTNIVFANKAWQKLTGYELSEVLGRKVGIVKTDKSDPKILEEMSAAIRERRSFTSDGLINRRKDGTEYNTELTLSPVFDETGEARFFVGIQSDITSRKRSDQAKSEFISLASHQLRTPLTEIRWALSSLHRGSLPGEQGEMVDAAHHASVHMAETINAMLMISNLEMGQLSPVIDDVDVARLFESVGELSEALRLEKHQPLEMECAPGLTLKTDEKLLKEILLNLLTNAYKYSPPGAAVKMAASSDGGGVTIRVMDNGFGIPLDEQSRLFEKFFRASNVVDRSESGSGIGLHMVYSLVKLLNGSITFESHEDKGTTFILNFPHHS